jgi:hypothetical protein
VTVEIRNDDGGPGRALTGAAAVSARPGGGLRGLDERVRALGGSLESGPLPSGGFRLAVTVPCAPATIPSAAAAVIDAPRDVPGPASAAPADATTPGEGA